MNQNETTFEDQPATLGYTGRALLFAGVAGGLALAIIDFSAPSILSGVVRKVLAMAYRVVFG